MPVKENMKKMAVIRVTTDEEFNWLIGSPIMTTEHPEVKDFYMMADRKEFELAKGNTLYLCDMYSKDREPLAVIGGYHVGGDDLGKMTNNIYDINIFLISPDLKLLYGKDEALNSIITMVRAFCVDKTSYIITCCLDKYNRNRSAGDYAEVAMRDYCNFDEYLKEADLGTNTTSMIDTGVRYDIARNRPLNSNDRMMIKVPTNTNFKTFYN